MGQVAVYLFQVTERYLEKFLIRHASVIVITMIKLTRINIEADENAEVSFPKFYKGVKII